jgi:S1-C subfamily serine protease
VAGATSLTVARPGRESVDAEIIGFDPEMDLAYLSIPDDSTVTLDVASRHVAAGDTGVAYVVRNGQPLTLPVRVIRPVTISTEDIYVQGNTKRPGFEIEADIVPGDSGGPVVIDGKVVGVLWARTRSGESRAYAIDADRGGSLIEQQRRTGDLGGVDLTRC